MEALLRVLLGEPEPFEAVEDLTSWWRSRSEILEGWQLPFDRAAVAGFVADRLGFAFAGGYDAALRALVPELAPGQRFALCATEEGGAHPRAIRTSLTPQGEGRFLLRGHKRWSTMATDATGWLVVASVGVDENGKNRLCVVRVRQGAPGVRLVPMPAPAFTPEIGHAEVELDDVPIGAEDVLPGDGYDRYLKPFRTIEDVHVHGALLGYLLGVARRYDFPEAHRERMCGCVAAARSVALADPTAPVVHVALAGVLEQTRHAVDELEPLWERVSADERARWERDRPLFSIAGKARAARRESAWRRLSE